MYCELALREIIVSRNCGEKNPG